MATRTLSRWLMSVALAVLALVAIDLLVATSPVQGRPAAALINCSGSVQACIDAANDGDTILIAAGRYTESLTLNKPVSLTGVNSDMTILHAVAGQRVLTVTGATISNSVVISGWTFTGGEADYGGGLLITDTAQLLLRDLIFINNDAISNGGGLFAQSNLTLVNSQFISNTAREFGGGIYAIHDLTVTNGEFMGNHTTGAWPAYFPFGGGIYAQSDTLIINSRFVSNSSSYGGGLVNTGATLTLIDSDFTANSGGGVSAGIDDMITGYLHISGGHFSDHASGPALNAYRPTEISGTQFIRNTSVAARIYQSPAIITDSRFENNHCTECDAGGLYFYGSRNDGNVPLTLSNTAFISNSPGGAFIYQSSMITVAGSHFE